MILDNASTHKTPEVHAWLAAHPHVHFHFTPTGASWLNMIEAWFGIIQAYIDRWNEHPVPFVWTKTADQIVATAVQR